MKGSLRLPPAVKLLRRAERLLLEWHDISERMDGDKAIPSEGVDPAEHDSLRRRTKMFLEERSRG